MIKLGKVSEETRNRKQVEPTEPSNDLVFFI